MNNSSEYKKVEDKWFDSKRFKKRRLKYLVNFERGVEPGSKNYGIEGEGKRYIRVNDIGSNNKDNVYVKLETNSICNKEDILLCLDGSPGIVVRGFDGIFSTGLRKLELKDKELDYNYLFYSLNCDFSQECISFFSKGTTIMHSSDSTNYLKQPLPPKEDQIIISDYLDEATKRLNKVIENKKEQVNLIEEETMVLIKKTLTQGIKTKELKETNLFWIEKMNKDWKIKKVKHFCSIFVPQRDKPHLNQNTEGYPWITMEDIGKKELITSISNNYVSQKEAKDNGSRTLKSYSIIASCVGNFGVSSVNVSEVVINQQLQAYIPFNINPFFLRYFVIIAKSYYESVATSTTIVYVNQRRFENLPICTPTLEEQKEIVEYLDIQISKCDRIKLILNSQISKLEEYKKILINDVVTGKMKVTA